MNSEFLFNETIKRFAPRELSLTEAAKLNFACRKTLEEYPKRDLEGLLLITKNHLDYILSYPNVNF